MFEVEISNDDRRITKRHDDLNIVLLGVCKIIGIKTDDIDYFTTAELIGVLINYGYFVKIRANKMLGEQFSIAEKIEED